MKQVADSETTEILKIAQECMSIPGDFIELGCYEGDTSLLLAEILRDFEKNRGISELSYAPELSKELWIYDSFEGLPPKTDEDESVAGINFQAGALTVTKREVKARFLRANLPVPHIKKAWFADLTDEDLPSRISFAFLDGDFYQSIKDSFKAINGKMHPQGIIIVHDYHNPELPGVTQAVDEWLAHHNDYQLIIEYSLAVLKPRVRKKDD